MLDASLEVRSAVVYASLIVVLVFLPVFFLDGLAGSFFRPLALAYVLAILASLLVALTVTPALSLMLLPAATERRRESPLVARAQGVYRALLPRARRAGRGWAIAVARWLRSPRPAAPSPRLGEEFLPDFQETDFLMHWVEKPGTSLEAMRRITEQRQQGAARRSPACATSARTSAAPRSPTRSSGRTSPSSGSASIPKADHDATMAEDPGRSSTAIPACTATC